MRGGGVQCLSISSYGPDWAWANSLVPDFLSWYAREMGMKLVLLGPGATIDKIAAYTKSRPTH